MNRSSLTLALLLAGCTFALAADGDKPTIRCAIIGGMTDTGLWPAVSRRFQEKTGYSIEVVAQGNKRVIVPDFERGGIDLLTMHASDSVINLVADGYAEDPQPWARNDLLLVGPPADPAGIRGEKDAVKALEKIASKKCKLLMHASQGANEVLADLLAAGGIEPDLDTLVSLPVDRHRQMLQKASQEKAYALVGRIPFLNAKIPREDMEIMVQGDKRMRRPYLVIVAKRSEPDARSRAAKEFAAFLRSPETQDWLKEFGKGHLDDQPLFFPVELERPR